jgi:hypothetical protein
MARLAQYMTSGDAGAAESTVGRIDPVPASEVAEPEREGVPIRPPTTGRGSSEINYETLGQELVVMAEQKDIPLQAYIDDGSTTYSKIGEKHAGLKPKSSLVAKHRYRSWGTDFRDFVEDLPDIPDPFNLTGGFVGGPAEVLSGAVDFLAPLQRGVVSGMMLGGSELAHQSLFPGSYQPPNDLRYDVGVFLGSLAPYSAAYRGLRHSKDIQLYLTKFPKMRQYLEEMLVGGTVEGFRGLLDPEGDVMTGTAVGAIGGPVGVGVMKGLKGGWDVAAGSFTRPGKGTGSLEQMYPRLGPRATQIIEFFGNAKQGIDMEFKKIMDQYGIPYAPALLRPRDPGVRMATKKVSRATAAMPDLDVQSREMDAALDRMEDDVIAQLSPKSVPRRQVVHNINAPVHGRGVKEITIKTVYNQVALPTNTDTGIIIRNGLRKQVDAVHDAADQLYNEVSEKIGDLPIKTKNVIDRIEAMLKSEGFDDPATTNNKVNQVRNVLRDLKALGKSQEVPSREALEQMQFPSEEALLETVAMVGKGRGTPELHDAKYKWLFQKYKDLKGSESGPTDPGDRVKFLARDIIRDEIATAAAGFSDEAASLMLQANTKWALYKSIRWPHRLDESQLGKEIYETSGDDIISKIFSSVSNIRDARKFLGDEGFELARVRHLKNILWSRQPRSKMPGQTREEFDIEEGIDIAGFRGAMKNAGGEEGEIWKEMFRGEPDKYSALLQLNRVVNRVAPVRQAYAGVAEEAGGGEQGGIVGILGSLLSRTSMLLHFGGTKSIGKALTQPAGENIFLGAPWRSKYRPAVGRGPGQPLPEGASPRAQLRAKAGQSLRDVTGRDVTSRGVPTQATARMLELMSGQ